MEIGHLVQLAHPYLPLVERELLTIDYLMRNTGNKSVQNLLLVADTYTIANPIHTTER